MKILINPFIGAVVLSLSVFISEGQSSHKHTPTSLKSISNLPIGAYQIAAVCFLGTDCGDGGGFNIGKGDNFEVDSKKQCNKEEFNISSCPSGFAPSGICPFDNRYFQKCISIAQACSEKEYVSSCEDGKILDPFQSCDYDSKYQKCKCDPCSGYNYFLEDAIADGYATDGEGCNACGVMKFKRKINDCNGFGECECGGEIGSEVCWSGNVKKFANCNRCACTNGTIDIETYWCGGNFKCLFGGK